jgi:hypothetical protein
MCGCREADVEMRGIPKSVDVEGGIGVSRLIGGEGGNDATLTAHTLIYLWNVSWRREADRGQRGRRSAFEIFILV